MKHKINHSLDDTALDEPLVGFRPDVNANQGSDLLPEDLYRVKVYFSEVGRRTPWETKRTTFGQRRVQYSEAIVTVQVTDGHYSGWIMRQKVSTLQAKEGESSGTSLLRALGLSIGPASRMTESSIIKALDSGLASEPSCGAFIGWLAKEWNPRLNRSVVVRRSMRRFPRDGWGFYTPEIDTPNGPVVAHNHVRDWQASLPAEGTRYDKAHRTILPGRGDGNAASDPLPSRCVGGGEVNNSMQSCPSRTQSLDDTNVRDFWERKYGRKLDVASSYEIKSNMEGLFRLLMEWDKLDRAKTSLAVRLRDEHADSND